MSEMVDRVALAICDCEAAGPVEYSAAIVVAKCAIEAMREPTYEMKVAGDQYCDDPNPGEKDPYYFTAGEWRAMILLARVLPLLGVPISY